MTQPALFPLPPAPAEVLEVLEVLEPDAAFFLGRMAGECGRPTYRSLLLLVEAVAETRYWLSGGFERCAFVARAERGARKGVRDDPS